MQMRQAGEGAFELLRGVSSFFLVVLALGVVGVGSVGVALARACMGALRPERVPR